ncbi:hypothetical protein DL764_005371 [Monosporascus ibericus]|uniref:Nudix hydrolase domain-containing protein n=1 Tax=Monosporascus ibericus TaxID=155417 RepID=A0A4Q4TCE7_9PEZI|nr:hypothetical protein DL764_005371 [Monosporascus ibericus]
MQSLLVLGLLATTGVNAHPAHRQGKPGVQRRAVDLDKYRLGTVSHYSNTESTSTNPALRLLKRATYVETATELLKGVAPGAEFRLVEDHYVGSNGVAHVNFKQTVHGLDIDNADFNVNIAADGSVFSYGNSFYTGEIPAENPLVKRAFSDPTQALEGATRVLELPVTGEATAEPLVGVEAYSLKGTSGAQEDPEARLVYFAKPDGTLALTWRVETDVLDDWLLTYIDASSNEEIHGVVNYVAEATYEVFPWGINDPDEGDRETVTDPWDLDASEFTWHSDGSRNYTTTWGNNGFAQSNPTGGSQYENNYRPSSSSLSFEYPYDISMSTPSSYIDASVAQLYYTANLYHDLLYDLGFTEEAGNFQQNNNAKGGQGNDGIILNAQDGSGTNNANFATPADGRNGRMRMYIWTRTSPRRDCSFEAGVVLHEYTHGLSNRLTGGPRNSGCLSGGEAGGMGEGWSDFYPTATRLKPGDTRDTEYPLGAWVSGNPAGIREYVYSTNMDTNPHTYKSVDTRPSVHATGNVWATMLYEVLWNLIDKHGKNDGDKPTFDSNGVPTDGKFLAMKLVLDGMALQPCTPNFVSARDAILDADKALTGGDNQCDVSTVSNATGGALAASVCKVQFKRCFGISNPIMASSRNGNDKPELKKRAVAGSFLFRYPDGDEKKAQVALFRRSGAVRTYQHKLAPISGSVEKDDANPLATALREIKEETNLDRHSLEPLRIGKPYSFVDESISREWTINPFAFRLKDKSEGGKGEEGIMTDWEHEGWEWHDPSEVNESERFGGVPKLVNSLRRVWPEYDLGPDAGKALTSDLQRLRDDHESGARQLAGMAISTLREVIAKMDSSAMDNTWWENVRMVAWHLCKNGRESMGAAITSALVAVLDRIESVLAQSLAPPEKIQRILQAIDEQATEREVSTSRIRANFITYLRDNLYQEIASKGSIVILTVSSSSTISSCLLEAAASLGVALDLRILESRPKCEGASLAAKLLEAVDEKVKLDITLYTDSSAALAADGVDIVLIGADRISSDADVSNKTGSLPTVLSARHVTPKAKVIILSETEKIAGPGSVDEHVVEDNDPLEVTNAWNAAGMQGKAVIDSSLHPGRSKSDGKRVTIKNIYFEWVPASLIDAYVTERGLWSSGDIAKRSKWIGDEMDRFFKDL